MNSLDWNAYRSTLALKSLRARHPQAATIELTYGCNLRCLHCYNPTHRALPHELTTDEVCSIVSQIADLGVLTISFTGGEPLIRPDIQEILRHARSKGLVCSLLTNATRITPTFADFLEDVGVSHIDVSIYGAMADTYERMTGIPGSFRQFLRGLACLSQRTIPVTVRMAVTTINEHEVDAAQQLVTSYNLKFQYSVDIDPRTDGDISPLRYRLPPSQKALLDQRMLGDRLGAWISDRCATRDAFISCACGHTRFAVTPYGEMILCVAFPIPKFDLRKGTVREGWEILKRTVDEARPNEHDECPTCEISRFCRQGRADAWIETGDMSRCLPHYKEWAQSIKASYALLDPRRPR